MATIPENQLLNQLRGKLGNVVFKRYKDKTVVTLLPSKQNKRTRDPGKLKRMYESNFAAGVKYAQNIIKNVELKKEYSLKVRPGQSVYHYAISEYAQKYGIKKTDIHNTGNQ